MSDLRFELMMISCVREDGVKTLFPGSICPEFNFQSRDLQLKINKENKKKKFLSCREKLLKNCHSKLALKL